METHYIMAVASGGNLIGKVGKGYRWHNSKNAVGTIKRADGLWFCGEKTFEGYPLHVEYSLTKDMGLEILEALKIMQHIGIDFLKANGMEHVLIEKGVVSE